MPLATDTAVFAVSKGLAHRETLFGTGVERLTPVFCSIATHTPTNVAIESRDRAKTSAQMTTTTIK